KRELTQELEKKYDDLGLIAGDLFTALTERADLRAWLTLPDSYQACRMFVPPGQCALTLEAVGGESIDLGTYDLDAGETMIVIARTIGTRVYPHVIGGSQVGPSVDSTLATQSK